MLSPPPPNLGVLEKDLKDEIETQRCDKLFARLEWLLEDKECVETERFDKLVARLDGLLDDMEIATLVTNKFELKDKALEDEERFDRFLNRLERHLDAKESASLMRNTCLQYWEMKLERVLAQQKGEYDKSLAAQNTVEFETRVDIRGPARRR